MSYYNSMLLGEDHTVVSCNQVYDRLRGLDIFVITSCGNGVDASCNKRIRYDGAGGIRAVRGHFDTVINNLGLSLTAIVNSKGKCIF